MFKIRLGIKHNNNFLNKFQEIFKKESQAFNWLFKLTKQFPRAEVYLVGGAVRDVVLGRPTKDFDFVVRNIWADKLEVFLSSLGSVDLVGRSFGVFKFVPYGWDVHNPIDVALPRREHTFGTGGYRDVEVYTNPKMSVRDDLSRRDFTINAMAIQISNLKSQISGFIDPFEGLKDLKKKIIRAVGEPEDRFKEDYSRMLRAIRLACQLDFEIEKKTWQAISKNVIHLNDIQREVKTVGERLYTEPEVIENRVVPYEVIAKEFLKSFYYQPLKAFDLYDKSNAFEVLMPEALKMKKCPQPKNWHSEGDVWTHTRLALKKLLVPEFQKKFGPEKPSIELIMAVLFHDLGKPYTIRTPESDMTDRIRFNEHDIVGAKLAKQIAERLKFSSPVELNINSERLAWLVKHHMLLVQGNIKEMRPTTIEKYFFNPNVPGENLLKLAFVDISATIPENGKPDFTSFNQMVERIKEFKNLSVTRKELPRPLLNGDELMEMFNLAPGPRVGRFLEALRDMQLSGEVKTKEEAIKFVRKYLTKK